jgi:beta-mannosidase
VTIPVPSEVSTPGGTDELLVVALGKERALWFFAEYRDSRLSSPRLHTDVVPVDGGYRLTVTAENLVRDVAVLADKVHPGASVDDMLVTLLPGESAAFL